MSLLKYRQKRDFAKTAEPKAKEAKSRGGNLFVVQKHDASRLHYDFRLEMEGVLKSWAVPKGFPWQQGERRLAVHVEDHPLDYAHFEGIIPKGQYGGGTVMVWDTGRYELLGGTPSGALREGKLHLRLHGKKLDEEWTLVRGGRDQDEQNWFLIKTGGSTRPISKANEEHSALTGRTMPQIAREKTAEWQSNREPASNAQPDSKRAARSHGGAKSPGRPTRAKTRGKETPRWIEPMKAKLVEKVPPGSQWSYELKWDGYRALAIKRGARVELISRNQKSMTRDFPEVSEAVAQVTAETAVIDGEICALDAHGRPRFQLLQNRGASGARPEIFFYAFDLLHLDGRDLTRLPLEERKHALEGLLGDAPEVLRYSRALEGDVQKLLEKVRAQGMEGLIGKRRDSEYESGKRTGAWVKIKVSAEQEFVIGGYTEPKGTRDHFGALLVGYYAGKELHFAGKVGTGFDQAWLDQLYAALHKIEIRNCPFVDLPRKSGGRWGQAMTPAQMRLCTWVRPKLVCQVRFAEWTGDGSLRQPVFLGLRGDKDAREVVREQPGK